MLPHHALPPRHRWGLIGGSDIKQLPHHGAFDKEKASHVKSHGPTGSYMGLY